MSAMQRERSRKPRLKVWIMVFTASVLAALLFSVQERRDTVTFVLVDEVTRQPVTNAQALVYRRRTSLPIEKVPFLNIRPWITTYHKVVNGEVKIHGIPRPSSSSSSRRSNSANSS